jgi:flagellin
VSLGCDRVFLFWQWSIFYYPLSEALLQTLQSGFVSIPRYLNGLVRLQEQAAERLTTGKRINRPADDPAAFSLSISLQSEIRAKNQAAKNTRDGVAYLDTLESALKVLAGRLSVIKEISLSAGASVRDAFKQADLQNELDSLSDDFEQLFAAVNSNGMSTPGKVFSSKGPILQIGGDASADSRFDLGQELNLDSLTSFPLTISHLPAGAHKNAGDAVGTLDQVLESVIKNLGRVAAAKSRLTRIENNLLQSVEKLSSAEVRITEANFIEDATQFIEAGIRAQTAVAVLVQGNLFRQTVARLLLN